VQKGSHGRRKRKGEQCLTGPLLFMVKRNASLFSVSDVDWHTGFQFCRPAVQATRPSNILFFQRQMGERESLDDASLLDKEDCWEFAYLPHGLVLTDVWDLYAWEPNITFCSIS
jgi:hypothetical protein